MKVYIFQKFFTFDNLLIFIWKYSQVRPPLTIQFHKKMPIIGIFNIPEPLKVPKVQLD